MRKAATTCEVVQLSEVPPRGAELSDDSPVEMPFPQQGGAESGALLGDDERLRVLLEAWTELPESVKDAACGDGQGLVAFRSEKTLRPESGLR